MSKGLKYDSSKAMISLICKETLEGMAAALRYGMIKYTVGDVSGRDNYKKGLAYTRVADSAIRHLLSFLDNEDMDPESGLAHIDHALAALNMLKYQTVYNLDMDDRFKRQTELEAAQAARMEVFELVADEQQAHLVDVVEGETAKAQAPELLSLAALLSNATAQGYKIP